MTFVGTSGPDSNRGGHPSARARDPCCCRLACQQLFRRLFPRQNTLDDCFVLPYSHHRQEPWIGEKQKRRRRRHREFSIYYAPCLSLVTTVAHRSTTADTTRLKLVRDPVSLQQIARIKRKNGGVRNHRSSYTIYF